MGVRGIQGTEVIAEYLGVTVQEAVGVPGGVSWQGKILTLLFS